MAMLNRRDFGSGLLAGSVASLLPPVAGLEATSGRAFPAAFRWGCSTSAYQIEGGVREDGRGPSIWDDFSHKAGRVKGNATGDTACDGYHRYKEDSGLLKGMGANAYRLSVAWPRIFPTGRGAPNQRGVDHYKRVLDDLLEKGIEPHVTLFHWDLPSALRGGWQARDTCYAFADYAGYMAGVLSDRVGHFVTTNEIRSFVDLGYGEGQHAPGLRLPPQALAQVRHHALLAHGLGLAAVRAAAKPGTLIGMAENMAVPIPILEAPEHVAASRKALRHLNDGYLTTALEGRYTDDYLHGAGRNLKIADQDMKIIGGEMDFVSLNYYTPFFARAAPDRAAGFAVVPPPRSYPTISLPWLKFGPEGMYWAVRLCSEVWKPKAIFLSENGCPSSDVPKDGRIDDLDRVMFLRAYLSHLQRAVTEGYPVAGYFIWSLLDNFEWAEGYSARFGLHHTDFTTQKRTPKLSAAWYKAVIAAGAVR